MSVMQTDLKDCPQCHAPLMEIDHFGERLVGCIECNKWSWRGSQKLLLELPDEPSRACSSTQELLLANLDPYRDVPKRRSPVQGSETGLQEIAMTARQAERSGMSHLPRCLTSLHWSRGSIKKKPGGVTQPGSSK
jgi:hypothetical protein